MTTYRIRTISAPRGVGDSNAIQRVSLDGVEYELRFLWSQRAGSWFIDLRDSDGDALMAGKRVVPNVDLLGRSRPDGFPPGQLWAFDGSLEPTDIGLRDFGRRVTLLYLEEV